MVEVQEPADLSIFLEWKDYPLPGRAAGHLGLDDETASSAVVAGVDRATVDAFVTAHQDSRGDLLAGVDAPFRVHRLGGGDTIEAGFSVLVVAEGTGQYRNADGDLITGGRGETIAVPHAWGTTTIEGDLDVIVARPPLP